MTTKSRVGRPFPSKWIVFGAWILAELFISESQILAHVDTCAFDWDAYMEQVSKMLPSHPQNIAKNWNFNYTTLNGDTGPLVYPAGHVWIHLGLKQLFQWDAASWTTEVTPKMIAGYEHRTIRPADTLALMHQFYILVHLVLLVIVFLIYNACGMVEDAASAIFIVSALSVSRRTRNIITLGFFNDSFAMLVAYFAVLLFVRRKWMLGSIIFSCGVSVKMNVLLFAPGLLVVLLCVTGRWETMKYISICALVQLVLASPFLLADPVSYVSKSFNLGRSFDQEWSVNGAWLPSSVFTSRLFSFALLGCQVTALLAIGYSTWVPLLSRYSQAIITKPLTEVHMAIHQSDSVEDPESGTVTSLRYRGAKEAKHADPKLYTPHNGQVIHDMNLNKAICLALFSSNFIGIVFARSLHFQFLLWYFHQLPFLVACTPLHRAVQLIAPIALELLWGHHPPAWWSSLGITVIHAGIAFYMLHKRISQGKTLVP